ncbi:hypothetical protein AA313_de0205378 [Arthrobotrys entomopaga]|nr:hypothetical protein AA313_de0205378 [Arthrobotrys entomopaga]
MKDMTFSKAFSSNYAEDWTTVITNTKKPLIAAVSGYAYGGGCEIAMMADILYCTGNASFRLPELRLAIIPGAGGTQRLTRAIGKTRAMEILLTGKSFTGDEAEKWGLASRTFNNFEELMRAAVLTARTIAGFSAVAAKAVKEAVNASQELSLAEGVKTERRLFYALFASQDQKLGMQAFVNKTQTINWSHQ